MTDDLRDRGTGDGGSGSPVPEFWRHPGPQDKIILALSGLVVLLALAAVPARVYFVNHPWVWAIYNGSVSAMVICGADVRVHDASWWAPLVLGVVGAVHVLPLWWWMGHRWGREFIDSQLVNYRFVRRHYPRFERWTRRYAPLVIFASYVPGVPIPLGLVVFVLADAGMSLRRFLGICVVVLTMVQGLNLYLGYVFGHQVVEVVRQVNRYGTWIALALVIWVMVGSVRRARRGQGARSTGRRANRAP